MHFAVFQLVECRRFRECKGLEGTAKTGPPQVGFKTAELRVWSVCRLQDHTEKEMNILAKSASKQSMKTNIVLGGRRKQGGPQRCRPGRNLLGAKSARRFDATICERPPVLVTLPAPESEKILAVLEPRQPYDGDTAFKLYIKEVGQTQLLTPAEERKLATKIRRGDKAAREQMIKANLRLVVKIARDYEGFGLPLLDLINEGNIGLMTAVERFDPNKGAKLSTYSAWWIKQAIKRALANQSKTIRLPVHVVDKLFNIRRAESRLQDVLGRDPTNEELGHELGMTGARVSQLRLAAIRPASLEAPLGDEDSNSIADVTADEAAQTPYEELAGRTSTEMIREMVAYLDPREARIIRYRFGLDGNTEKTLEEVGEHFGVTRERIRQIQEIALRKLRKMVDKRERVDVPA